MILLPHNIELFFFFQTADSENRFRTTFQHYARFRMQTQRYKADPFRTMAYVIFAFHPSHPLSHSLFLSSLSRSHFHLPSLPSSLFIPCSTTQCVPGEKVNTTTDDRSLRARKFMRVEIRAVRCIKVLNTTRSYKSLIS